MQLAAVNLRPQLLGADMTEERKSEHLHISLEKDVSSPELTTGLEGYAFVHDALPTLPSPTSI